MLNKGFSRRALVRSLAFLNLATLPKEAAQASTGSGLRSKRVVSRPALDPLAESAADVTWGADSNAGDILATTVEQGATPYRSEGYWSVIDLTPRYTFLHNQGGFNASATSNAGRSGIAANRVRAVHEGQGDVYAFNASITVSSSRPGAQHWLANPAGVLFGGTVIGAADGVYLNPIEVVLSDQPGPTAFNCTGVGAVYNLNRNRHTGQLGQTWAGIRIQSVGTVPIDNMLSGTGQFTVGLDLSMPDLDFGRDRAAIALKAGDRIHFNASASERRNSDHLMRANWVASPGSRDYCEYDATDRHWRLVLDGHQALTVSSDGVSLSRLTFDGGVVVGGQPVTGWRCMTGPEDREAAIDTTSVTLEQLARRVKALESALHQAGGANGFLTA